MTRRTLAALGTGFVLCLVLALIHIDRAFGLPAHPLLVHIPVILDPLLVLASIVFVIRPAWRTTYALPWAILALVALAGTVLAAGAGDYLFDREGEGGGGLRRISPALADHKDAGETLRLIMIVFVALVLLVVVLDWARAEGVGPGWLAAGWIAPGLAVAVVAVGIGTGYFTVRAGHLGAKAVWERDRGGDRRGGPPGSPGANGYPRAQQPSGTGGEQGN